MTDEKPAATADDQASASPSSPDDNGATDGDGTSAGTTPPPSNVSESLAASMSDTARRRHTSGSITRAIARQMLAQEKDTRTFGRRGALLAAVLIVAAAILPVILVNAGLDDATAEDVRMLFHRGPIGAVTLWLLIAAAVATIIIALRHEGMHRAKGLFWTGAVAFLALIAGRPGGPGDVVAAASGSSPRVALDAGSSLETLAMLAALLAWAGMLVAARLRLTFDDSRSARAIGAVSAGLFLIVFLVSDTGMSLFAQVFHAAWPWGLVLVGVALVPVVLSLVGSEAVRGAQALALVSWFVGLGLALGAAAIAVVVSEPPAVGALVTLQYIGVFMLLIVGSIDWIGQLLFRYRADREAARQLATLARTRGRTTG